MIGDVRITNIAGNKRTPKVGDEIREGEKIETGANGHLHIRFVDEGNVSVRPNSVLHIERYHYDKAQPKNSIIKFRLEQGVLRSLSGKATEAAHERFRLNTPIAAIGVLGTDFIVHSNDKQTQAVVHSGAIAIAPLNNLCAASALGACQNALRLDANMKNLMIDYHINQEAPRLVPIQMDHPDLSAHQSNKTQAPPQSAKAPTVESTTESTKTTNEKDHQLTLSEIKTNISSPFAWARWSNTASTGDTISVPYAEARDNRSVTVGIANYALFRTSSNLSELTRFPGKYEFALQRGQVQFTEKVPAWVTPTTTAGKLDHAALQIDFANRQFETQFSVSHPIAGSASMQASGVIRDDGIMNGQNSGGRVAGALSLEGAHASLLHEIPVTTGTFVGVSDWLLK